MTAEVLCEQHGADGIMLVMPTDRLADDKVAVGNAVQHVARMALESRTLTFEIRPTKPETGYGNIEFKSNSLLGANGVREVIRFVEKPQLSVADELVAGGRHLWNGGMFSFTAETMLAELGKYTPALLKPAIAAVIDAKRSIAKDDYTVELDIAQFARAEGISIDYAVMDRSDEVKVVPYEMGWSDTGSWLSISKLTAPDGRGNRIHSGAERVHVYSRGTQARLINPGVMNLVLSEVQCKEYLG